MKAWFSLVAGATTWPLPLLGLTFVGRRLAPCRSTHGFQTIKLRLHVGRAPELYFDLVLLALKLDSLLLDTTPLFVKFRTDCEVASHLASFASERKG
jgi:hypothetical protein